jgi:RIO kinase 1
MGSDEHWDEIRPRSKKGKKKKQYTNEEERLDAEFIEAEGAKFVKSLETEAGTFAWMKEKRYSSMFNEIESGIQGVLGKGQFEWVDRRVFDQVFDRLTLLALFKLMKSGVVDTIDYPIARGKEAHVFHGTSADGKEVAVKIFHTSNAVFKNLVQYIEGDMRFKNVKKKHRDLVEVWVRKEFRNLTRLHNWGLSVPEPLGVHKNVLVMQYIGTEEGPSPKLREVDIDNTEETYAHLVEFLAVAWQCAELVHGDFSPYNILYHDEVPTVIDVGQAVISTHPKAQEFLVRDVKNLVDWAQKAGIEIEVADCMYDILHMDVSNYSMN